MQGRVYPLQGVQKDYRNKDISTCVPVSRTDQKGS